MPAKPAPSHECTAGPNYFHRNPTRVKRKWRDESIEKQRAQSFQSEWRREFLQRPADRRIDERYTTSGFNSFLESYEVKVGPDALVLSNEKHDADSRCLQEPQRLGLNASYGKFF